MIIKAMVQKSNSPLKPWDREGDRRHLIAERLDCGFTLIELLIVMAIVGTLAAMLLPAVQYSRETARRSDCQNRLRQLGLAVLQYESAMGHLPPGHLGPVPARKVSSGNSVTERDHQLIGLLPYLLPYLEQAEVYAQIGPDMLDFRSPPSFQLWVQNVDTWTAANNRISAFLCPSATPPPPTKGVLMFLNPYANADGLLILETAPILLKFSRNLGTTTYLGNAGYFGTINIPIIDEWRGPFTTRSHTRLSELSDGTTNTLLLGESVGGLDGAQLVFAHSWMGCGALPLAFGIGDRKSWSSFNSEHPGLVGFCYADGSVHFIGNDVSQEILEAMSGISEGEIVSRAEMR